ncbi:MAG: DUF5947 family protein [Vulcanimicrobiaceae bacterium]
MAASDAGFAALQTLLKKRPAAAPGEQCDFCATPIEAEHGHLIDLNVRRIMCACRPCAIVFEPAGAARGRYKTVPRRYVALDDIGIDDELWESLQIPIGLAFFFRSSAGGKLAAFYPGPAGATESELSLDNWEALARDHPVLASLESDVEAILVRRPGRSGGPTRCYLVPIDAAYELVGLIRSCWRGFDGGSEALARIDAFFVSLAERGTNHYAGPRY